MIAIKLREAMEAYHRRTGQRITYPEIAEMTGLSENTVEVIGGKLGYVTTTKTIEKLCRALGTTPCELLEMIDDPPESESEPVSESEPSPKKTKKKTTKKKAKKTKSTKKKKKNPKKKK